MSVSSELLCSFELLKPLDFSALKSHIKKGRNKRQQMLNSPVSVPHHQVAHGFALTNCFTACHCSATECLRATVGHRGPLLHIAETLPSQASPIGPNRHTTQTTWRLPTMPSQRLPCIIEQTRLGCRNRLSSQYFVMA